MSKRKRFFIGALLVAGVLGGALCSVAFRANRAWNIAKDARTQLRYLVEGEETIGEVPATTAFSSDYLQSVFGDDPELLDQLKTVVHKGLDETPVLNLGEVSAMVVTFRRDQAGTTKDVVVHVIGGFPVGKQKTGFHRDGYFKKMLDSPLWNFGNRGLSCLGRDMVLFAKEETIGPHKQLLEAIFDGNVMPLVESLDDPLYYTIVFPDPKHIVPTQLKRHIHAVIMKGSLEEDGGKMDVIFLTPSSRSARYAFSVIQDLKISAELALQVKWGGVMQPTQWNDEPVVDQWWAYEMVQTSKASTMERESSIIRIRSKYGRVMQNAVLKTIERMGTDLAQMRNPTGIDGDQDDESRYWSKAHRWGPNWPIAPESNADVAEVPAEDAQPEDGAAEETAVQ